jgi:hypothetical protein
MLAAAAAPSGSDAVVAVLLVLLLEAAEGRAHLAHKLLPLVLLQVVVVLAPLVVEPEVPVHLRSRQSFSASTARISPPPVQPTYERAPSTR